MLIQAYCPCQPISGDQFNQSDSVNWQIAPAVVLLLAAK